MNIIRRCCTIIIVLIAYTAAESSATAQGLDPSAQISAAVDLNNFNTLTAQLATNQSAKSAEQGEGQLGGAQRAYFEGGKVGQSYPDSGYTDSPPDWDGGVLLLETFNDKNSFIGKGDTDTFSTQLGWNFKTPIGTVIQPFVAYQWTSTGYGGPGSNHSDGYGLSLNVQQKIIPLEAITDSRPGATQNIGDTSSDPTCKDSISGKEVVPDHFPNFDVLALLNFSYLDSNLSSLKGEWNYDTQEAYTITPGIEFDLFPKKSAPVGNPFVPCAINVIANYADAMTSAHNGASSSAGVASLSERNTYLFPLRSRKDCDQTILRSLSLIEVNTIFHDTNQEPLPTSTTPIAYQNWARFGLALQYGDIVNLAKEDPEATKGSNFTAPVVKLEYDYDAFNAQYQAHTVTLTMNFTF